MYINKTIFWAVSILAVISVNQSFAQSKGKTDTSAKKNQSFILYVGGGLSSYISSINPQPDVLQGKVTKTSAAGTIRLMWHPAYLLRIGIESGFTNFYSYQVKNGNTTGKVKLSAVPILVEFSMPILKRVEIFAGLGDYILTTDLNYEGTVKTKTSSLGSNLALAYTQPIGKNLGIAAEAKWMNAFETKDNLLSLQVLLAWKFKEY